MWIGWMGVPNMPLRDDGLEKRRSSSWLRSAFFLCDWHFISSFDDMLHRWWPVHVSVPIPWWQSSLKVHTHTKVRWSKIKREFFSVKIVDHFIQTTECPLDYAWINYGASTVKEPDMVGVSWGWCLVVAEEEMVEMRRIEENRACWWPSWGGSCLIFVKSNQRVNKWEN